MSSASRVSDAAVNPTRSTKSTVTTRRSATAAGGCASVSAASTSSAPHSLQNLAVGVFAVPQDAHGRSSEAPQSLQNFPWGGLSAPQFLQIILSQTINGSGVSA